MKRLRSNSPARGQFTLSALLLVTCLLLLALGPFHAAQAYLRGDAAMALGKPYRDYLHKSPLMLRAGNQPGPGTLTLGEVDCQTQWVQGGQPGFQWNHLHLKPPPDHDWPQRISLQFEIGSTRFQIHGVHDPS